MNDSEASPRAAFSRPDSIFPSRNGAAKGGDALLTPAEQFWTIKDIAQRLHVSVDGVKKWIIKGELAKTKAGSKTLVSERDLQAFLKRSPRTSSPEPTSDPKFESARTPKHPPKLPESEIWTAEDVAAYLRLSSRNVRTQASRGIIPGKRIGSVWRFRREVIIALLK